MVWFLIHTDLHTDGGNGIDLFKKSDLFSKHVNPSEIVI